MSVQRVAEIIIDFWKADWARAADTGAADSGTRSTRRAIWSALDRWPAEAGPAVAVMGQLVAPSAW